MEFYDTAEEVMSGCIYLGLQVLVSRVGQKSLLKQNQNQKRKSAKECLTTNSANMPSSSSGPGIGSEGSMDCRAKSSRSL